MQKTQKQIKDRIDQIKKQLLEEKEKVVSNNNQEKPNIFKIVYEIEEKETEDYLVFGNLRQAEEHLKSSGFEKVTEKEFRRKEETAKIKKY